jgi:ligand-binding sensor domain-containing protein/signal transduction histidine kinase/DNA-binding response OmpR family regulator
MKKASASEAGKTYFLLTSAIIILHLFFIHLDASSQSEISFRQLSVNDGLSQNSAVSVTQDSDGFLWIATQDGLNRYDGRKFKFYNRKFTDVTQASHLHLGKVFADSKNRIWIIPDTSVPELLNRQTDDFVPVSGIESASCIVEDNNNTIWIGTFSGQLFKWNEKSHAAELLWTAPFQDLTDIEIYNNESLLLVFKNGVVLWNTKTQSSLYYNFQNDNLLFSSCALDSRGNIWVGTLNKGVWIIPNGENSGLPFSDFFNLKESKLQNKMVLDIITDSNENIWIATYGKGAIKFNIEDQNVKSFEYSKQNPRSLHYNDVLCLFEDYTGTLWFGTDGAGLSFFDTYLEKFNFFLNQQVPENINIDVVRSIFVDEYEYVWIGTSGKGLTEYNPASGVWTTYTFSPENKNGIASNRIMSLWGDGNGKLWIGYQDGGLGILDLDTRSFKHFSATTNVKLSSKTIWRIFNDSKQRYWLATRNEGLINFDPQVGIIQQFSFDATDPHSIPGNNIRAIAENRKGELWIGTEDQGIARLDPNTGKFLSIKHQADDPGSISSNSIKSIYPDDNNILWIGTNGAGIDALNLNNMEVTSITTREGLANDVIYGILPDIYGNLWLSSNKGISKISITSYEPFIYSITNYTNYDGLTTEFNTGAYYQHDNGSLYFGSLDGFYWFNPGDIKLNETPPKTAITDFFVFNEPVDFTTPVKLKHNQNTVTINMASLVFSSPGKNEFMYKLDGHDLDWVFAGNNYQARYTNLNHGNYTFLAKSSNYDGVWNETPISYSFGIMPPWYKTFWAIIGYFLMLGVVLFGVYIYFKWRWYMQLQLRLKEKEAAGLKELNDFKSNFFTNISHEFRTPLTLITGPVDRLIARSDNPVFNSQLLLIKQNSLRLLNLVDQLLEVSRIRSGKHRLFVQKGNLGLLIQTIIINYFHLAAEKNIKVQTEIPLMTEIWFDADKIEKIISNLMQNAIKYGKRDTVISIHCIMSEGMAKVSITNESNISYKPEEIEKLHEKFFQKDPKRDGFGIGVSMVRDLVQICHGQFKIDYTANHSFIVSVELPVTKYGYKPDEVEDEQDNVSSDSELLNTTKRSTHNAPIILIVEDNEDVRRFIAEEFQNHYQVLEASNGKEGLYIALKKIPDLIISDIMMPEMDGIAMCRNLKTDEKSSHIPIILLTAKSDEEDIMKGIEAGADDYFLKPVAIKKLVLRAEKLIELRARLRSRYDNKAKISPQELALTSMDEKFLEKVQRIVDEDMAAMDFSVDIFCKKTSMSRMQLHRKLTALTGLSTSAFIRDQRLQMAVKRLKIRSETISEVAYAVGFNSPSYFIKCFKETFRMTPVEYQETLR